MPKSYVIANLQIAVGTSHAKPLPGMATPHKEATIGGRVGEIERIIGEAEALHGKDDPDIRIALCPEHYLCAQESFAGQSDEVPFFNTLAQTGAILRNLKALSDKYPKWIIVPGTITVLGYKAKKGAVMTAVDLDPAGMLGRHAAEPETDRDYALQTADRWKTKRLSQMRKTPEKEFRPCYNLAPVYLGGQIVMIRRKHYEDVKTTEEGFDLVPSGSGDRKGLGSEDMYFPVIASDMILVHDGVRIGIEICAEFEYGALKHAAGSAGVDIHVVLSNEMYPFRENAAMNKTGIMVQSDTRFSGVRRAEDLLSADIDPFDSDTPPDTSPKDPSLRITTGTVG